MATYYKAKVGSLAGLEKHEIIHFGYMDTDSDGYEFIIIIKGCKELVKKIVLEHRGSFEDEWESVIPGHDVNGTTVKGYLFKTDEKQRNIHIYYSDYRKARERSKLQGLAAGKTKEG